MDLELRQELSSMSGKPCLFWLIIYGSVSLVSFVCMCICLTFLNRFLIQAFQKMCTHWNLISAFLSCLICFTGALRRQLYFQKGDTEIFKNIKEKNINWFRILLQILACSSLPEIASNSQVFSAEQFVTPCILMQCCHLVSLGLLWLVCRLCTHKKKSYAGFLGCFKHFSVEIFFPSDESSVSGNRC